MKSLKQIKKEISRLKKLSNAEHGDIQKTAYEAWHTLRWVVEDVDWTPTKNCQSWKQNLQSR